MNFQSYYRTKPAQAEAMPPPAAAPTPAGPKRPVILSRSSSIKVSRPSISGAPSTPAPAQPPSSERPSISVSAPHSDSIVAQNTPTATPKPSLERKNTLTLPAGGSSSKPGKRPRDKTDGSPSAMAKRPKVDKPSPRKSRIVTLRHPRLREILRTARPSATGNVKVGSLPRSSASPTLPSIQAKPARKPLPSFAPSGGAGSSQSPPNGAGPSNGAGNGGAGAEKPPDKPRPIIKLKIKPREG